jgi:hypothetical protein
LTAVVCLSVSRAIDRFARSKMVRDKLPFALRGRSSAVGYALAFSTTTVQLVLAGKEENRG